MKKLKPEDYARLIDMIGTIRTIHTGRLVAFAIIQYIYDYFIEKYGVILHFQDDNYDCSMDNYGHIKMFLGRNKGKKNTHPIRNGVISYIINNNWQGEMTAKGIRTFIETHILDRVALFMIQHRSIKNICVTITGLPTTKLVLHISNHMDDPDDDNLSH